MNRTLLWPGRLDKLGAMHHGVDALRKEEAMTLARMKVPVFLANTIISLGLGAAAGVACMILLGYGSKRQQPVSGGPEAGLPQSMRDLFMGKGGVVMPPPPTQQLNALVEKLDLLTGSPLRLELSKQQRKELAERLAEILVEKSIAGEAAKAHLDVLLKVLEPQKEVLLACGFYWPSAAVGGNKGAALEVDDRGKGMRERLGVLQKRLKQESK